MYLAVITCYNAEFAVGQFEIVHHPQKAPSYNGVDG